MEFTKLEAKQWAKKHYKGLDGNISPSFTPDLKELDEEGIRHDMRHHISKGMFSFLCEIEGCSLTFEERKRFLEIACDEARGKILVPMFTGIDTIEQDIELLKHFEKVGGTHTLLGWPGTFYQAPENPRIVRMFNLFAKGEFLKAMDLYWELAPITLGARSVMFNAACWE
jgi:4-hydroxy-tetrahydrodipicolinate synthase